MTLLTDDLKIATKLPDIPKEMPVFDVRAAALDERQNTIELLRNHLELGKLATIQMDDSLYYASRNGEVQYYRPSGAIWARNALADEAFNDEIRPWKDVKEVVESRREGMRKVVLAESMQKEMADSAQEIMAKAGLSCKQAYLADVELEQVAQLDEKGQEAALKPGEATVRYLYRLEDIQVDGPGAKSYFYFNPFDGRAHLTGAFHAWREVVDSRPVRMYPAEQVLDLVLTRDRELIQYHERGATIELTAIDLVYYALPPFAFQEFVFPALRVIASVADTSAKPNEAFEIARFFHATSADDYMRAECYANYLTTTL